MQTICFRVVKIIKIISTGLWTSITQTFQYNVSLWTYLKSNNGVMQFNKNSKSLLSNSWKSTEKYCLNWRTSELDKSMVFAQLNIKSFGGIRVAKKSALGSISWNYISQQQWKLPSLRLPLCLRTRPIQYFFPNSRGFLLTAKINGMPIFEKVNSLIERHSPPGF